MPCWDVSWGVHGSGMQVHLIPGPTPNTLWIHPTPGPTPNTLWIHPTPGPTPNTVAPFHGLCLPWGGHSNPQDTSRPTPAPGRVAGPPTLHKAWHSDRTEDWKGFGAFRPSFGPRGVGLEPLWSGLSLSGPPVVQLSPFPVPLPRSWLSWLMLGHVWPFPGGFPDGQGVKPVRGGCGMGE